MLDRCVNGAFAGLLLTFSLSLLAFYSILAELDSKVPALSRRSRMGRRRNHTEFLKLQMVEQFSFERAIEAYEELIDSTLADRQA